MEVSDGDGGGGTSLYLQVDAFPINAFESGSRGHAPEALQIGEYTFL